MNLNVSNNYKELSAWERECKLNEILFKNKPKVLSEKQARIHYKAFYNTILDKVKILWNIHQIKLEKVFEKIPTKVDRGIQIVKSGIGVVGAVVPPVLALSHVAHIAVEIAHLVAETAKEGLEIADEIKEAFEQHGAPLQLTSESILYEICFRLTLRYRGEIRGLEFDKCKEFALVMAYQVIDKLKTCDMKFGADCTQEQVIKLIMDHVDPDPTQEAFRILNQVLAKHNFETHFSGLVILNPFSFRISNLEVTCEEFSYFDSDKQKFKERFTFLALGILHKLERAKGGNKSPSILSQYSNFSRCIGKIKIKSFGKTNKLKHIFPGLVEFENWGIMKPDNSGLKSIKAPTPLDGFRFKTNSWGKDFSNLTVVINRLSLHKIMLLKDIKNDGLYMSDSKFMQEITLPANLNFMLTTIKSLVKNAINQKERSDNLEKRLSILENQANIKKGDNFNSNIPIKNLMVEVVDIPDHPEMIEYNPIVNQKVHNEKKTIEFMKAIRKLNAVDQIKALVKAVPLGKKSDLSLTLMKKIDEKGMIANFYESSREYLRFIRYMKSLDSALFSEERKVRHYNNKYYSVGSRRLKMSEKIYSFISGDVNWKELDLQGNKK